MEERFTTKLRGCELKFLTASGIFSVKQIDFGTRLLADNAIVHSRDVVLDLGCGYGAIGISVKKSVPSADVYLSDVNKRAVAYAGKNCAMNKAHCKLLNSDLFSHQDLKGKLFNAILTNPPFSAGKSVCAEFIKESYLHLSIDGSLQLVAMHNKGGSSLKKIMFATFGNASDSCKKAGFRVYISIKKK
jgi:16S rRNA (guanine1207-N2)-methyltransferase